MKHYEGEFIFFSFPFFQNRDEAESKASLFKSKNLSVTVKLSLSLLFQVPRGLYVNFLLVSPDSSAFDPQRHPTLWHHVTPHPQAVTFAVGEYKACPLICKTPHAAGTDVLGTGLRPGSEACSCSVLNWFSKLWLKGIRANTLRSSFSALEDVNIIWRGSEGFLCDRFFSGNTQNRFLWTTFSLDVLVVDGWRRPSSLSPAYSHMPKDYNSIMTALLHYWEDMQTSGSTPLLETPCWAFDWKYEHTVHVLSRSIYNNNQLSN